MSVDPNQIVDQVAQVAKSAVAVDKKAGGSVLAFAKSREFWLNVVGVGSTYLGYIPSKYAPYALGGLNLLLHYLQAN